MKKFLAIVLISILNFQLNMVYANEIDNINNSGEDIISSKSGENIVQDVEQNENLDSVPRVSGENGNIIVGKETSNANTKYKNESVTFKGEVITAGNRYEEEDIWSTGATIPYQDVRVRINEEGYNTIVLVKYQLTFYMGSNIPADELKVGDKVYVTVIFDENGTITDSYIEYISNERFLIAMVIVYAGAILLIGGFKGLKALIGLVLTILSVFFIMVPLIFKGYPPLLITILTCILVTAVTFIIVSGFSKKTLAAIIGTAGGIIVAGIFAIVFGNLMKLTGACTHSLELSMIENGDRFDFEGIMISGIIVGALRCLYGCWNVNSIFFI